VTIGSYTWSLCVSATASDERANRVKSGQIHLEDKATSRQLGLSRAVFLYQHGLFRHSHVAIVVVLPTRIAEQRSIGGAVFGAGVFVRVPTLYLRELSTLR
jgi:hypothetical protein